MCSLHALPQQALQAMPLSYVLGRTRMWLREREPGAVGVSISQGVVLTLVIKLRNLFVRGTRSVHVCA